MWSTTSIEGFHGTTLVAAESIVRNGFKHSEKDYDWLGDGVYFWQDGPYRAREWALKWAVRHYGGEAAVVGAKVNLERSTLMDLIDIQWWDRLRTFYEKYLEYCTRTGKGIPKQEADRLSGAHRLDRAVVNYAIDFCRKMGDSITAVRAAFIEGKLVYPSSAFYDRAHVQIAVREGGLIGNTWIEDGLR
jgi:hypothetical protein